MKIYISSNFKKHFNTYIDFLDHNWIKYFDKKNYLFKLIPNSLKISKKILKEKGKIDLIILAGGNDVLKKNKLTKIRLDVERNLIKYSIKKKIPLLGVCRGMQVLNYHFDGSLKKITGHMRSKTLILMKNNLFGKSKIKVKCFHNYCITPISVSKKFNTLAEDQKHNVEMFVHKKHKIFGVMWHPERESDFSKLDTIINEVIKNK